VAVSAVGVMALIYSLSPVNPEKLERRKKGGKYIMTQDCCATKRCCSGVAGEATIVVASPPMAPSCCDSTSGKCASDEEACTSSRKAACCGTSSSSSSGKPHDHHDHHGHHHDETTAHLHHHHDKKHEEDLNSSEAGGGVRLCLAVVRENGADVVIFDATGVPRTFRTSAANIAHQLCFRSHGFDDLLTPCFDNDGKHGAPDESCFCGVETPHLHAHVRDPKTCGGEQEKTKLSDQELSYWASQTLHPAEEEDETKASALGSASLIHIPVTESMPNQCNYKEAVRMSSAGSDGASHPTTEGLRHRQGNRRMHKVQHDDHVDYLVHNAETGQLHLEHPCTDCGSSDVHGKFNAAGERRLQKPAVQLHFFTVSPRPFNLLECVAELFEPYSDRVAAVENILPHHHSARSVTKSSTTTTTPTLHEVPLPSQVRKLNGAVVRSTIKCTQICCASEIPLINSVLQPLKGIASIRINVPLKQVLIDHDPGTVTAAELQQALTQFGATVMRDGGGGAASVPKKRPAGRSQFYVLNICCASEIPAINGIVEPLSGVKNVAINTTTKMVYVDHELDIITAAQICAALNAERFGAEVKVDAAATALQNAAVSARSAFVKSTLLVSNDVSDPDTETLTTFLQTFVETSQLETFVVDVPTKTIVVVHNPFCLTAEKIAELVSERTQLEATVSLDGADPSLWTFPQQLQDDGDKSGDDLHDDEGFTYPRLTVMVSGVLWIISMLSLIGGNW
jgi:copper chaperone CopZ